MKTVRFLSSKRFWKRMAIVMSIVVGLLLIVNGLFSWRAERRLQHQLDLIRADGHPASIAELAPEPVPPDQNAAAIVRKVAPRIEEFANEHGQFFNTPIGKEYDEAGDRGEPPTTEQIAAIRAIVDKYPDVAEAVVAAAACDRYASLLDFSLNQQKFIEAIIDQQSEMRQAARFLHWKVEVALATGDTEAAMQHGLAMLRLARLYDNEPSMVSFLIAIAIRGIAVESLYDALSAGEVSQETHAALDAELALQDDPGRLQRALISERAMSAGWFDAQLEELEVYKFVAGALGWPLKNYQTGCLLLLGEYLDLASRPWHDIRQQFGVADSPAPPSGHGVLADLLMPAIRASFQANARGIALLRCLRIYNALRQYAEKNGGEATRLDDLSLPHAATIDPYSGEPLRLRHTKEGWIVYTVMENGIDDGGDFKGLKDYGVAPRKLRSTE
jgi:hypothetical protein